MSVQISALVEELAVLPEQDSATMRLLGMLDDPDVEARDVVPVIEADPSMTARLLTLANSAFFGVKATASNVWSAVMVVGFNVVRALAASGTLGLNERSADSMPKGFFLHSVASGAAASVIARHSGVRSSDAFSAALLHDVGAALLYRGARAQYEECVKSGPYGPYSALAAEKRVFGHGHDEIGAVVLEYLHFPQTLVDAVRNHNADPYAVDSTITQVVIAAVALAEAAGHQSCTEPAGAMAEALTVVGLAPTVSKELIAELQEEIANLRALLA